MEKVSERYLLNIVFYDMLEREDLIYKKYNFYLDYLKSQKSENEFLIDCLKEFKKESKEHSKLLKDKMIKLSIKG